MIDVLENQLVTIKHCKESELKVNVKLYRDEVKKIYVSGGLSETQYYDTLKKVDYVINMRMMEGMLK